ALHLPDRGRLRLGAGTSLPRSLVSVAWRAVARTGSAFWVPAISGVTDFCGARA
ncbi:hypothetical protein FS749_010820, partial [Ceratobasidium sp. UAMH 11750]